MTGPAIALTSRYAEAVRYACDVHAAQSRKGTRIPYAAHLIGVSSLVVEAGGDEDLAIAALLHDAAEDHGGEERLADIARRFGSRVARIVRECSDSLEAEGATKADWDTRKREHLRRLEDVGPDSRTVWAADKVHNGRAIVVDLELLGRAAMDRFNAAPERVLWYYEENLRLLTKRGAPPGLIAALGDVVARMRDLLPSGS